LETKSIIFATRLVGVIAGIFLIMSTFFAVEYSVNLDKKNEIYRAVMLYDLLFMKHPSKEEFEAYRLKHKLTPVGGAEMKHICSKATPLIEDELLRKTLQSGDIEIFVFENHYYYSYKMDTMFYYRSDEPMTPYKLYIGILFVVVMLILLWLFTFISSSIKPLKALYVQIQRFANGEKGIHIYVEGNDEVAQVANAFDESVKKTQSLQRSRSLFLRNVMHELKTPISKGKLLMHFLEGNPKDKLLLEELFEQMEQHLDDLARVESLSEKNLELNLRIYAVVDLVDQAIDLLGIEREYLEISLGQERVEVDFKLFTYAIKNLLDNAVKYADSKPIFLKFNNNTLTICNTGRAFESNIDKYFKAYERDLTQHSLEGMGLGLYIVHEIVKRHCYLLSYEFYNGMHCFSISFNKK
jgi:signal transduction histidine kinase